VSVESVLLAFLLFTSKTDQTISGVAHHLCIAE